MDSEDADLYIDYVAVGGKAVHVASGHQDEAGSANDEEDSCDSFSTDASLATSVVAISATSSDDDDDNENDQVIPKSFKARNKSRVILSDSDESGSDCEPPPAKIKRTFQRIKPVKDNSSSSSESEQDNQPSTSRSHHQETESEDSDDDEESDDQEEASRRSRRLKRKQNPSHAESPKRRYKITFENESEDEDDSGTEKSWDSEEESDDSDDDGQCYICQELDPDLDVSEREGSDFSSWCKCKCCAPTPGLGDYDRICCQELQGVRRFLGDELAFRKKCITEHPRFAIDVLKFQALKRTKTRSSFKCKSRSRCFKAQWSFLRMIYDRIGSEEQAVIPACVFKAIWNRFHNDGLWHNWYAKYHCEKGPHCHNMELRKEIELD